MCRCSWNSLSCDGSGEGVGIGADSHHSSVVGVVAGDGVGIGAGSHHSSVVSVCGVVGGVVVGDGVDSGASSHQSSDVGVFVAGVVELFVVGVFGGGVCRVVWAGADSGC